MEEQIYNSFDHKKQSAQKPSPNVLNEFETVNSIIGSKRISVDSANGRKATKFTSTVSYLKKNEEPTPIPEIENYRAQLKYKRCNVGAFDN